MPCEWDLDSGQLLHFLDRNSPLLLHALGIL
jgi:hypothetical protein